VDAETGVQIFSLKSNWPMFSSLVAGNVVYFGSTDGNLYALM